MIGNFIIIGPLFSFVAFLIMRLRRNFYRQNQVRVKRVDCPVISIGNISVGGTGKTPTVSHFLSWLSGRGFSPGVVSEGYRGSYSRYSKVVSVELNNSEKFGDEPSMLKRIHPSVPIYLSKRRIDACRELIQNDSVDVIVADDAFQHLELHRDVNIVLIDVLEPLSNYTVIPFGRARESLKALKYANYIILNKVNLTSQESVSAVYDLVRRYSKAPITKAEYVAGSLARLSGQCSGGAVDKGQSTPMDHLQGDWSRGALLVSGIGNPEAFERLVKEQGIEVLGHLKYRDHHKFSDSDIRSIFQKLASCGADGIIVTDKDTVKISEMTGDLDKFWSLGLEMKFDESWSQIQKEIFLLISHYRKS